MLGYDVHEALYLYCETHGTWVSNPGSGTGSSILENKWMHVYNAHESFHLNCESHGHLCN